MVAEFVPTWKQPSHPDSLQVVKGAAAFQSSTRSLVALPAGAVFGKITTAIPAPEKTYTSVQCGPGMNIELCSDLVYCNHSCSPSLEFDMSKFEVRVARNRPWQWETNLTFFYPSTEWDMVQPFCCICGTERCLGLITSSENIAPAVRQQYWLNPHVEDLAAKQEAIAMSEGNREKVKVSV